MAQLRDLIVNGASRFLGVVIFNNETHFNNISNFHNNVNFNSNISLSSSSTLNLLNTTAAAVATYNSPALVIGPSSGTHLEIDSSQIIAKKSVNEISSLYLNPSGGQIIIGQGGLSSSGKITITQGDAASATANTGALQVTGGIRAAAGSYFASSVEIDGVLNVDDTATMRTINPETKETYNLGTSENRWNYLYAQYLDINSTSTLNGKVTAKAGIEISEGDLDIKTGALTIENAEVTNEIIGNLIVGNGDNEAVLTVKNGIGTQLYYINNINNNNMAYFTYNSTDDSVDLIFI